MSDFYILNSHFLETRTKSIDLINHLPVFFENIEDQKILDLGDADKMGPKSVVQASLRNTDSVLGAQVWHHFYSTYLNLTSQVVF